MYATSRAQGLGPSRQRSHDAPRTSTRTCSEKFKHCLPHPSNVQLLQIQMSSWYVFFLCFDLGVGRNDCRLGILTPQNHATGKEDELVDALQACVGKRTEQGE
eukprot:2051982-Amphidinium_carterae.1